MTPKRTAMQTVVVQAFPAKSINARDCFLPGTIIRGPQNRGHIPCRAHVSRASNTRCCRRQCNRKFGSAHGVSPIHHGARSVLLEMSTTKSVRSSAPSRWSGRFAATTPSNTSCSLKLMVWRGRVSLDNRLRFLSKGTKTIHNYTQL